MTKTVKAACTSCGSTGLYSGMCEPEGTAVVCLDCNGSGCHEISYTPFVARIRKRGIKLINESRGRFIVTGVGATGRSMTYAQFEENFPAGRADAR